MNQFEITTMLASVSHSSLGIKVNVKTTLSAISVFLNIHEKTYGKRFVCWPSQKKLSAMTGFSQRQVREHIELLRQAKLIVTHQRFDNSLLYFFTGLPLLKQVYDTEMLEAKTEKSDIGLEALLSQIDEIGSETKQEGEARTKPAEQPARAPSASCSYVNPDSQLSAMLNNTPQTERPF